jgi:hypothetical protein
MKRIEAEGAAGPSAPEPAQVNPRTVADTGVIVRFVSLDEQEAARALIALYADLTAQWQQLCERLSTELERREIRRAHRGRPSRRRI